MPTGVADATVERLVNRIRAKPTVAERAASKPEAELDRALGRPPAMTPRVATIKQEGMRIIREANGTGEERSLGISRRPRQ